MFAESVSAILISGILFVILGIYDIASFYISRKKRMEEKFETNTKQSLRHGTEVKKVQKRIKTKDFTIICTMCGEKYPKDTIHKLCVACGTPLETSISSKQFSSDHDNQVIE